MIALGFAAFDGGLQDASSSVHVERACAAATEAFSTEGTERMAAT